MHPDEQALLVDWYNSLIDRGNLSWDTGSDLCGQSGVECYDSSPYQRVQYLYILFLSFFVNNSLHMFIKEMYIQNHSMGQFQVDLEI